MIRQQIEDFCKSIGLDTIGFIPCRTFEELRTFYEVRKQSNLQNEFEEQDIEKRINPNRYMEDAKTIVSIAFPYCDLENPKDTKNGFSIYTQRLDYHKVVKSYLDQIAEYIQSLGGKAIGFVDSNALPERYIAYLAGIGFIGKNNMLITKKYGSYVFLGEMLIDLDIDCEDTSTFEALQNYSACGACEACIKACPTKAINNKRRNPNICLSYITQKKDLTSEEINLLKGNLFGCDSCQSSCPCNEQIEVSSLQEFKTLGYMQENVTCYAQMNNQYFKEKISKTSCGWRGKNVIKRNAIIAMKYEGKSIENLKGDSPYINHYIEKLDINK